MSELGWHQIIEKLKEAGDRSLQKKLLSVLQQEVQEGRAKDDVFSQALKGLYRETKDPWLSGELKRLENRMRSRRILGRDLLRLTTPPVGDAARAKLWKDLHALKTAYEESLEGGACLEEKYDVLEEIGDGGMSVVFRAIRRSDSQEVAIKYLSKPLLDTPSFVSRFQRECRLSLSFDHGNVVKVFEAGEHNGQGFMVMEYLPLGGVDTLLGDPALTPCLALTIIRQTAQALSYIHAKKVIHRDIKLANILIKTWAPDRAGDNDKKVQVKLADFGLSKELPGDGLTKVGTRMGTDFYVAPEQREAPGEVDQRADIYSLGVALYRLMSKTGFPEGDYPLLHEMHPDLPPELDELLKKCLKVNPADRLASIDDLAKELLVFEKAVCDRNASGD